MKTVKIYGSGCKRCEKTESLVKESAARLGLEVDVQKITDAKTIAMAGVMSTPGLSIDGKLVHSGGLPTAAKLDGWLSA